MKRVIQKIAGALLLLVCAAIFVTLLICARGLKVAAIVIGISALYVLALYVGICLFTK